MRSLVSNKKGSITSLPLMFSLIFASIIMVIVNLLFFDISIVDSILIIITSILFIVGILATLVLISTVIDKMKNRKQGG